MLPFALGVSLALVVGTTLFFAAPNRSGSWLGAIESPFFETAVNDTPVLVIVVGTVSRVKLVRDAIDLSSLVVADARGFALDQRSGTPRRIVAADYDAVGPLLDRAGWVDAELEIATPPRRDPTRPATQRRPADGELNIAELAAKPTLTLAEALALLNHDAL